MEGVPPAFERLADETTWSFQGVTAKYLKVNPRSPIKYLTITASSNMDHPVGNIIFELDGKILPWLSDGEQRTLLCDGFDRPFVSCSSNDWRQRKDELDRLKRTVAHMSPDQRASHNAARRESRQPRTNEEKANRRGRTDEEKANRRGRTDEEKANRRGRTEDAKSHRPPRSDEQTASRPPFVRSAEQKSDRPPRSDRRKANGDWFRATS